jgi:AcrR family transcriptional regulator
VNPRATIARAAKRQTEAQQRLKEAAVAAHGSLTIGEIADAAGVTRPTVYAWLKDAGVEVRSRGK